MYIVFEMQTNGESTAIVPPTVKADLPHAQQAFYTACAAAAVSDVEQHTVMLVYSNGNVIESKSFDHREAE